MADNMNEINDDIPKPQVTNNVSVNDDKGNSSSSAVRSVSKEGVVPPSRVPAKIPPAPKQPVKYVFRPVTETGIKDNETTDGKRSKL